MKYQVTKEHLTGVLKGLKTVEITTVSFEQGKVYKTFYKTSYKVINVKAVG